MKFLTRKETCGGKRQKEYSDLFAVALRHASNQIIGEVADLVAREAGEDLGIYKDEVSVDDYIRVRFLNTHRGLLCSKILLRRL